MRDRGCLSPSFPTQLRHEDGFSSSLSSLQSKDIIRTDPWRIEERSENDSKSAGKGAASLCSLIVGEQHLKKRRKSSKSPSLSPPKPILHGPVSSAVESTGSWTSFPVDDAAAGGGRVSAAAATASSSSSSAKATRGNLILKKWESKRSKGREPLPFPLGVQLIFSKENKTKQKLSRPPLISALFSSPATCAFSPPAAGRGPRCPGRRNRRRRSARSRQRRRPTPMERPKPPPAPPTSVLLPPPTRRRRRSVAPSPLRVSRPRSSWCVESIVI